MGKVASTTGNKRAKKTISKQKLKKSLPFLQLLHDLSAKERELVLQYVNPEGCELICQCIHNSINNRQIPVATRATLVQGTGDIKDIFRYLSNKTKPVHLRQRKLTQVGGNPLGLILAGVLPLITHFLFPK